MAIKDCKVTIGPVEDGLYHITLSSPRMDEAVTLGVASEAARIRIASVVQRYTKMVKQALSTRIRGTMAVSKGWMHKKGPQRWSQWE